MNIHITRADHDACRMLAGRALHSGYTGGEFFDENIIECQPAILRVFLDEAIGCFILNACDGAGTEDIVAAEKLFGIFVRDALIISRGEIKVDIRYLVSIESEENGERDVMPVLCEVAPALRAFLIRQVEAAADRAVFEEMGPVALRTDVVRREGIHLCDA